MATKLDNRVAARMLSYLPLKEIVQCGAVCRQFRKTQTRDDAIRALFGKSIVSAKMIKAARQYLNKTVYTETRFRHLMQNITSLNLLENDPEDTKWYPLIASSLDYIRRDALNSLTLRMNGPDGHSKEHADFPGQADEQYASFIQNTITAKFTYITDLTLCTETAPQEKTLKALAACIKLKRLAFAYKFRLHLAHLVPDMPQTMPEGSLTRTILSLPHLETILIEEWRDPAGPTKRTLAQIHNGATLCLLKKQGFTQKLAALKQAKQANQPQPL